MDLSNNSTLSDIWRKVISYVMAPYLSSLIKHIMNWSPTRAWLGTDLREQVSRPLLQTLVAGLYCLCRLCYRPRLNSS